MRKVLSALGNWATKIESWLALGSMAVSAGIFGWLGQQVGLLASQGWAALTIFALLSGAFFTLTIASAVIAFRGRRAPPQNTEVETAPHSGSILPPPEDEIYEGAHEELMLFVTRHLMPTCDLVFRMQSQLIYNYFEEPMADIAASGLLHSSKTHAFSIGHHKLSGLSDSPAQYITFKEMIDAVDWVEKHYAEFVEQTDQLADALQASIQTDEATKYLWEEWRKEHSAMVEAYEPIKQNSRMGKLFRPARASRWGRLTALNALGAHSRLLWRSNAPA